MIGSVVKKIKKFITHHKIISGLLVILIAAGGYYGLKTVKAGTGETRYVVSAVQKGTIISSISGSGQISASDQVDIKPKVSGTVVYINLKNGQEVKAGTILAQIDSSSAQKSVRDAKTALETAQLELEQTIEPPDELTLLQAENALTQLKESRAAAEDDIKKSAEDGFNAMTNAFFDLPAIMTDLENLLYGNDVTASQDNIDAYSDLVKIYDNGKVFQYRNSLDENYKIARAAYDKNFDDYKRLSRYSDTETTEALLQETYNTVKSISETLKNADNLISYVTDILTQYDKESPKIAATHKTTIKNDTTKTSSILSSILSAKNAIQSTRDSIVKTDRSIAEKELSLEKLKAGADQLSLRSKKLAIQQKEDALLAAQENLADYYVRAPFDGVVTNPGVKKGDSVSSGTTVATIITKQRIAGISLNEVDIAKVKAGQKVNLTFDAVSDLNITGAVAEVDTLGTVSQGVVNYDIKIIFDTQDERVKPGMSVSASIITDVKQDVLMVANSAIKTSGDMHYVEILENASEDSGTGTGVTSATAPKQQLIEIGLANDSVTEIISGLNEGDKIITRTITAGTAKFSTSGTSLLQGGKTTGNATRVQGGGMMMISQ